MRSKVPSLCLSWRGLGLALLLPAVGLQAQLITSVSDLNSDAAILDGVTSQRENDLAGVVVPFGEDVFCYTDRTHQYNGVRFDPATGLLSTTAETIVGLPAYLIGGEYVSTRNDNRDNADFQLQIGVGPNVTAYLLIDNRVGDDVNTTPPTLGSGTSGLMRWVADEGWRQVNTGMSPNGQPDYGAIDEGGSIAAGSFNDRAITPANLGTGPGDGINNFFTVYRRDFNAGATITLKEQGFGGNMYGLVVVPRAAGFCNLIFPLTSYTSGFAGDMDPPATQLNILIDGDPGPVSYSAVELDANQVASNVTWMSLSKTSATNLTPGTTDTLAINYSIDGLEPGIYTAYVRLIDSCAPGNVYLHKVTLELFDPGSVILSVADSGSDGPVANGPPISSQRENDWGYPLAVPAVPGAIVPFDNGVFAFTDRNHKFVSARYNATTGVLTAGGGNVAPGIPTYLIGGEYVATRNNNRDNASFTLTVKLNPAMTRGVWAYLLLDNRIGPAGSELNTDPPVLGNGLMDWVATDGWTQYSTGLIPNGQPDTIGIDEGATPADFTARLTNTTGLDGNPQQFYTIYRKGFFPADPVNPTDTILLRQQNDGGLNMYGLVVVPRIPCKLDVPAGITATSLQDGAPPADFTATVRNSGDDGSPTSYTIAELDENQNGADVPWLNLSKLEGGPITGGATDTFTLSFDTTGLVRGDYVAYLRITDDCTPSKARLAKVTLTVQPPDLRLPQRMAPNGVYVERVGNMTWDEARVHYNNNYSGNLPVFEGSTGDWLKLTDRYLGSIVGSTAVQWMPATDADGVSPLDNANLGVLLGTAEGTFKWLDGTAIPTGVDALWNAGEPNDFELGVPGEDAMEIYPSGLWNDNDAGPSLGQDQVNHSYYLVYENVDVSGQGQFRVLYRPGTTANLDEAITLLRGPETAGDAVGRYYAISMGDPGTGGNGSGSAGGWTDWPKVPWPNDDPTIGSTDDDNFVSLSVGLVTISEAGTYTFVVAHDDDCQFTLGTQDLIGGPCNAAAPPCVQTRLPGATVHSVLVTFDQPGDYPIELIQREGTGGSYLQLFATKGDETEGFNRGFRQVFYLVGDELGGGLGVKSPTDPCGPVFADADRDGDVDQYDYGHFQACFSGAAIAASANCLCFDRDGSEAEGDGDVDPEDLAAFLNCFSGPSIAWTQESAPNCVPARP